MIKTLMHKNDPVAKVEVNSANILEKVIEVYDRDLLPEKTDNDFQSLQKWFMLRRLSLRRGDIDAYRVHYGSKMFISDNLRSLADCYWLKKSKNEDWDEIKAFGQWRHINDPVFLMMYDPTDFEKPDEDDIIDSPNLTLSCVEKNLWFCEESVFGFINANVKKEHDKYKIAKENNISIVAERKPIILNHHLFMFIPQSTSVQVEAIPFDALYNSTFDANFSKEANLQKCCEQYKIPGWKKFFNELIQFDELCEKTDRELYDIRVLRNSDTLEVIGFDKI